MNEKIDILSKSSSGNPYIVTFYLEDNTISAFCSCPAGEYRKLCKHILNMLNGDDSVLYDSNQKTILAKICSHLQNTSIPSLFSELSDKATYQILNLSPDVKIARKILRTLENYAAEKKVSRISKGDLWRRIKNSDKSVQTVASITEALEILIDHNYIRKAEHQHGPGRPAEIYELNPVGFHPTNPTNSFGD